MFLAVKLAQERGLLPTAMGSAELQEMTLRMKERVFFAARLTNLQALDKIKKLVEKHIHGEGAGSDLARLRVEARKILANEGYTPEGGFPGDEQLGIPPATAGSLRDLSSEKRLNLIFETQAALARGLGMKLRNLQRMDQFPAIELVRMKDARQPDWRRDWLARWKVAAENVRWEGVSKAAFAQGRMIATQTSPVWAALGSSALFADALNVDHPPFAFNSGMGWRFVGFREAEREWGFSAGVSATPQRQPPEPEGQPDEDTVKVPYTRMPQQREGEQIPARPGAVEALRKYLSQKYDGPDKPTTAPDATKLARLEKLRAKFDEITAQRGY